MEIRNIITNAGMVPPHQPEAEKGVIGAMLRSGDAVMLALESLHEDDFYDPAMRELFSAITHMTSRSKPIDIVTVSEEMTRRGRLEAVGGMEGLIELTRGVPATSNVGAYIKIVDEKSTLRKLIGAADEIHKNAYGGELETPDILALAEKSVYDITMRKGGEQLQPVQPVLLKTFEMIEELVRNQGRIEGVPSGYTELDNMTTGFHPGELVLIAARPSMGKTSFGMNIIGNAAIRGGKKAAVFSLALKIIRIVTKGTLRFQGK